MGEESEKDFENAAAEAATDADVQAALNAYAKALQEEFEERNAEAPEDIDVAVKEFFRANVPSALAQIVWLANNAESESVRLSASKLVMNTALHAEIEEKDPVAAIIEKLKKNDKNPQPANRED